MAKSAGSGESSRLARETSNDLEFEDNLKEATRH